jgi:protein-S-isoprenylcysteine O-methyltransferase Ste14
MYLYSIGDKINYFSTNVYSDIIGWVLIILSTYIFYISFKNYNIREFLGLDRLKSSEKVFYPLKVGGINKNVRHPLYSFSYTLMFGIFLVFPNDYVMMASLITAIYLPIGIYFEEQKLIGEYGDKYREYMKEVPMLIPKLYLIK